MNFLKRSFKSITRKKGKTIVLLCVVFLLALTISICLVVSNSVNKLNNSVNSKLSSNVIIYLDYDILYGNEKIKMDKDGYPIYDSLTIKDIEKIAKSKYVKYYDYSDYLSGESNLKRIEDENEYTDGPQVMPYAETDQKSGKTYFSFRGTNLEEIRPIQEKSAKLIDGSNFSSSDFTTASNNVIIYKELAELNNINVGDTIKFSTDIYDYSNINTGNSKMMEFSRTPVDVVEWEVKVIGIVDYIGEKPKQTEQYNPDYYKYYDTINTLYMANNSIKKLNKEYNEKYIEYNPDDNYFEKYANQIDNVIFALNDSSDIQAFIESEEKNLPGEYYSFASELNKNKDILAPVNSMKGLFNMILIGGTVGSVLILTLLIYLFVKDRQKEMGIYLSIGEKRRNVILQVLVEVLVVSLIGITLSIPFSSIIADNISSNMLQTDLDKIKTDDNYSNEDYYLQEAGITGNNISNEYLIETYNASLSVQTILIIYALFIGTVLVSIIIPSIYILRLSPKKIMM